MQFRIKFGQITTTFLMLILACSFLLGGCKNNQEMPAPPPAEVVTITVKERQVELTTELPGRTSAFMIAEVRPQVSGIIQKRMFTEGSDVKAGALLYQIDPAPFQAAYDSASASLARAQASLPAIRSRAQRFRELLASGAVSQQNFDDVDSAFRQAEAEVKYWKAAEESSRINLEHTRVTAPISGRTGRSNVTEGALVTANQPSPLVTVQQLDPIYVDVPKSTAELLRLRRLMEGGTLDQNRANQRKVKIILEDGTPYPLEGTLQFQDVTVNQSTGTVILRAVFPNPGNVLLPGMFVRGVAKEGVDERAILIPQQAVTRDPKGNPLTLIVDGQGKVQQRQITIDRAMGDQWLVTDGLAAGEKVIIEGIQKVRPGAAVKAISSEEADAHRPEAENATRPAAQKN